MKKIKEPKILKYDITFNWHDMKWEGIHIDHLRLWEKIYPDVDAFQFLTIEAPRFMMRYVVSREGDTVKLLAKWRNRNWPKTINNWLMKQQQKAVGL
jgi:hypothetical protein